MSKNTLQNKQLHLNKTVVPLKEKQKTLQNELNKLVTDYEIGIKKVATQSLSLYEKWRI